MILQKSAENEIIHNGNNQTDEWRLILISNLSKLLCLKVDFVMSDILKSLKQVVLFELQFVLCCLADFPTFGSRTLGTVECIMSLFETLFKSFHNGDLFEKTNSSFIKCL